MNEDRKQQGFSLVELMVALTVTLIISGAVFRLLTAGKGVFRREPALSTRQQSIRFGMDMVWKDVFAAGTGLPMFSQAFTDGLNGIGALGSGGAKTDEIEIISTLDCNTLSVCAGFTGSSVTTYEPLNSCFQFPALVVLSNPGEMGIFWAEQPGAGATGSCGSGAGSGHVTLPHGQSYQNPPGGLHTTWTNPPQWMSVIRVIRYRVAPDADGVPNLWRSYYGGLNMPDGTSSWEPVAQGVEDLQVQYLNGTGNWLPTPGTSNPGQPRHGHAAREDHHVRPRHGGEPSGNDHERGRQRGPGPARFRGLAADGDGFARNGWCWHY